MYIIILYVHPNFNSFLVYVSFVQKNFEFRGTKRTNPNAAKWRLFLFRRNEKGEKTQVCFSTASIILCLSSLLLFWVIKNRFEWVIGGALYGALVLWLRFIVWVTLNFCVFVYVIWTVFDRVLQRMMAGVVLFIYLFIHSCCLGYCWMEPYGW